MSKELPKMYQNKIQKNIDNIQKVYSTIGYGSNRAKEKENTRYSSISIDQKIEQIFSAPDYVYKADVVIVTDQEEFRKRIVARNRNNLITIDNEYIPISMIRDIYK